MIKIEEEDIITKKIKEFIKKNGIKLLKKAIIFLLPVFGVLIILSAIYWFITQDDGIWEEGEEGNPEYYTSSSNVAHINIENSDISDGITVDTNQMTHSMLLDMDYTEEEINNMEDEEIMRILGLDPDTDSESGSVSLDDYSAAEILWSTNDVYKRYLDSVEDLDYLLNAEIITQFPKFEGVEEGNLNGVVQFSRISSLDDSDGDGDVDIDDEPQILTYISSEEFDQKFDNYINSGDRDVFNYYTLDEEMNAVIATWGEETGNFESNNTVSQNREKINGGITEETIKSQYDERYTVTENTEDKITATYTTYTANKKLINYKSYVEKYTLPFNYLWALLIIGRDIDFVKDLADLAYGSEIVIGIYDSTTTTVITDTKNYTENFRERYDRYEDSTLVESTNWQENAYTYYEKNIKTTRSNSTQIDLIYANTWIVEIRAEYRRTQTQNTILSDPTTIPDESWSDNGSYTNRYTENRTYQENAEQIEDLNETVQIVERFYRQKRLTSQSEQSQQDMSYDRYEKVKTEVKEKTDIETDTDENFVKLLRGNYNARTLLYTQSNIGWLTSILSQNSNTANMVELTEYLINKAKNPEDTSLTFDFSIYAPSNLNNARGVQNLSTYLRQFSHSAEAPKSDDGKYYLMYGDGEGWPTIGNADIQWKSHYGSFTQPGNVLQNGTETEVPDVSAYVNSILERGPEAEYTNEEISNYAIYIEVELVDDIGDSLQSSYYNYVLNIASGLNLSRQQVYALTAIAYNFGHLPERNGYTFRSVYEAGLAQYEVNSWEHNKFIWDNWWSSLGGGSAGHIPSRDAAFETYVKGVYDFTMSSAGEVFSRNYYIYYTQEQLNEFSYAPSKTITRTTSNEEEIFTYEEANGESILAAAEELHSKYEEEEWTYYSDTSYNLIPNDVVVSLNHPNKITCCATYVSGVLYLSGYASESELNDINIHSSNAILNFMRNRGDCTEITSYDGLQPGDIVFMTSPDSGSAIGHVQIYAGDNQCYNAGNTNAIRQANPYSQGAYARNHFVTALRIN